MLKRARSVDTNESACFYTATCKAAGGKQLCDMGAQSDVL